MTRIHFTLTEVVVSDIPAEMDHYNNLFPLEPPTSMIQKSNTFHYPTMCYKAVNTKDGLTYCIRRIQGNDCKHLFNETINTFLTGLKYKIL